MSRIRKFVAVAVAVLLLGPVGLATAAQGQDQAAPAPAALQEAAPEPAAPVDYSDEIAEYDRILETTPPDEDIRMGDTYFTREVFQAMRDKLAGQEGTGAAEPALWPGGDVFYTFDADISAERRQHFLDAAAEWSTFAKLRFIPRPPNEPAYIRVRQVGDSCGSYVGRTGVEQTLDLPSGCWQRPVVLHEIGHALGFHHEHVRPDRDQWVTVPEDSNCGVLAETTNWTTYDFLSIMHYDKYCGLYPGPVLIVPKPEYSEYQDEMGTQLGLSRLDRDAARIAYGPPVQRVNNVVTNTKDSGPGSLRSAIYFATDRAEADPANTTTIVFQIPTSDPGFDGTVFTIKLTGGLPAVGDRTIITGATQTTFTGNTNTVGPEVVLNGSRLRAQETNWDGALTMKGMNSSVRSLVINDFRQDVVRITGARASGNSILACYIGTNRAGTGAVANDLTGVLITDGAHDNTIGGTTASARNVISGNRSGGVVIEGPGSDGNVVQGNYIGVNRTGAAALPNDSPGVAIRDGARSNEIGGSVAGARNVVSGNLSHGIAISGAGTNGNLVRGNFVGLNAAGTGRVGNRWAGVDISRGARSNTVGGTSASQRNVASGNSQGVSIVGPGTNANVVQGNYLGLNAAGTASVPNEGVGVAVGGGAQSNKVGGTTVGARNVVSGNTGNGVSLDGAGTNGNLVHGNYIGLNAAGSASVPNAWAGVSIGGGAQSNTVGGTTAAARNIVSGNTSQGVFLGGAGTDRNLVRGNFIGLNPAGTGAVPNGAGVYVTGGARSNLIGGTLAGAGNVVSGNNNQGVAINGAGTNSNRVEGNRIGTNAAGSAAVGNTWAAVDVSGGAQSNVIGGVVAGAGNTISGNRSLGVLVADAGTKFNRVQGNYIGTNAAGTAALPNQLSGVEVTGGASSNSVGGTVAAARNHVAGNVQYGVAVTAAGTTANLVHGNIIGRRPDGGAAANGGGGVLVARGATGNQIGGTAAGAGNRVWSNTGNGVSVWDAATTGNAIRRNSLSTNSGLGIDLIPPGGVTANDAGDGDAGPNRLQNYPVLASAVNGTATVIKGSLASAPSTTFRVEFFSSPSADPSGHGEGFTYLGFSTVTTDAAGNTPAFTFTTTTGPVPAGHAITATATDPGGNTSEFSRRVLVT